MSACRGRVVIEAGTGRPVARDEPIGWVSAPSTLSRDDLDKVVDCVTVATRRSLKYDVGYSIGVLVDIGMMALSPAVNDPRTGVECTEALTAVCTELSRHQLGIRTRRGEDGTPLVVVHEATIGDYLDAQGRQLLLYGGGDRAVTAALLRLGKQGERIAGSDRDRRLAQEFTADVESMRANGAGSHGRNW